MAIEVSPVNGIVEASELVVELRCEDTYGMEYTWVQSFTLESGKPAPLATGMAESAAVASGPAASQ